MSIRYSNPFEALFDLQRSLDARRKSNWLRDMTSAGGAFPPINIFRQGDDFVAIIELAGIDREELDIQAKDNTIRLSGQKKNNYPNDVSAHRRERVFGSFDRTISIPVKVDADNIKAEYRDGILALFIPQAEEAKPKTVKIN